MYFAVLKRARLLTFRTPVVGHPTDVDAMYLLHDGGCHATSLEGGETMGARTGTEGVKRDERGCTNRCAGQERDGARGIEIDGAREEESESETERDETEASQ